MSLERRKEPGEAWETVEATGNGGSQPTLPLDLGPGLFQVDEHGRATLAPDTTDGIAIQVQAAPGGLAAGEAFLDLKDDDGIERIYGDAAGNFSVLCSQQNGGHFDIHIEPDHAGAPGVLANLVTIGSIGFEFKPQAGKTFQVNAPARGEPTIAVEPTNGNLGFFGGTPVDQPAAPTTLADVIAALKALGLVAT